MEDMGRLNRIAEFWSWLPAFRAVAETEHVGRAAKKVYKSPSSLSRAVGQLEDNLGVALFEKDGRQIKLTDDGHAFLKVVRRAMRLIDDGMMSVTEQKAARTLYLQASEWLGWLVEQAAGDLVSGVSQRELEFALANDPSRAERLLDGEVDVLLTYLPVTDDELDMQKVGTIENAIYAGAGHPLVQVDRVSPSRLADQEFVVPAHTAEVDTVEEWPCDGWPREFRRGVRCKVDRPAMAAGIAMHAGLLSVLPVPLVEADERLSQGLTRVRSDFLLETPIFCVRRVQLMEGDATEQLIDLFAGLYQLTD